MSALKELSARIDARRDRLATKRNLRDRIVVCDEEWEYVAEIFGEESSDFAEEMNDTEEASFVIPGEHPIVEWLLYANSLETDTHFYLETADFDSEAGTGKRLGYKVIDIEVKFTAAGGYEQVTVHGLHDFEHVKHMVAFANTLSPPELQFPKSDMQWGRSCGVVRSYFHRNLARVYQPGWLFGFDLWGKSNWKNNMRPDRWAVIMAPQIRPDTSEWTMLAARFDHTWDLVKATLEDAGLQITTQRWLPGDKQPFPDHAILTKPTLVLDVVERSFLTGHTGSVLDPILDLVRVIAPDGTSETVSIMDPNLGQAPPAGVNPPVAIWRASQHQGLVESTMTLRKAMGHTVYVGGKSPDWLNKGIKLLVNSALGYIGLLIGLPALGMGIFDNLVEDVVLAFQRFTNNTRKTSMGSHAYIETFEPGGAWTLNALQTGRTALHRMRGTVGFTAKVIDQSPYAIGEHIDLGERGGFEIAGRIWLGNVAKLRRVSARRTSPEWELTIGDPHRDEMAGTKALRLLDRARAEATRYQSAI